MDKEVLIPFLIGFGSVLVIALIIFFIRSLYRRSIKKALSSILQEKEAVKSVRTALFEMRTRLGAEDELERRIDFIEDSESVDSLGLLDLRARAQIIVDDLDRIAIPKKLIPYAETLADIGYIFEQDIDTIIEMEGEDRLRALLDLDISKADKALSITDKNLEQYAIAYGISELAVYKGGFYV